MVITEEQRKSAAKAFASARGVVNGFLLAGAILYVATSFYMPAMVYTYSNNQGNKDPIGTLVSTRWSFPFIVQCLYPFFWVGILFTAIQMLYRWRPVDLPKVWFSLHAWWLVITTIWFVCSAIALSIMAGQANEKGSAGNFFNDYRYCCKYGADTDAGAEWFCRYNPGTMCSPDVVGLQLNPEGIYFLTVAWVYFLFTAIQCGFIWFYYFNAYPTEEEVTGETTPTTEASSEPEPSSMNAYIGRPLLLQQQQQQQQQRKLPMRLMKKSAMGNVW